MLRMFWRKEMNQDTKNKALWIFENIRESVLYLPDSLQGKAWKIIIDYSFGDEKSLNCEKNKRVLQTFYAVKPLLRLRGIAGSQNGKSNNPSGLAKQPEPNIGAIIGANIGANLLNNRNNNSNNNNNTPIIPKGDIDSPKEDIKSVNRKRNRQKIYYEKNQSLKENSDGHTDGHTDRHTDVTDKIRLDNTPYNPPRDNNTASPSSVDASKLNNYPVVVTEEELKKAEEEVKAFEKLRAERDMLTLGYVRDFSKPEEKPIPKKKPKKDKSYSYVGQVIKLTDEDYKKWKELYPNIDLFKNLNEIDDWLVKNNGDKNWFFRVQNNLKKRNEAANG